MLLRGYVATWLRGYAATYQPGYKAKWLHGCVVTFLAAGCNVASCLHGYVATWPRSRVTAYVPTRQLRGNVDTSAPPHGKT